VATFRLGPRGGDGLQSMPHLAHDKNRLSGPADRSSVTNYECDRLSKLKRRSSSKEALERNANTHLLVSSQLVVHFGQILLRSRPPTSTYDISDVERNRIPTATTAEKNAKEQADRSESKNVA